MCLLLHSQVGCLSLRCGVMRALQGKINDRFLLGGPTTLRGFHTWGVGPRAQGNHGYTHTPGFLFPRIKKSPSSLLWLFTIVGYSLGGDMYWAGGLHLYRPLPYPSGEFFKRIGMHAYPSGEFFRRIRMHAFLNAGNLISVCEYSTE